MASRLHFLRKARCVCLVALRSVYNKQKRFPHVFVQNSRRSPPIQTTLTLIRSIFLPRQTWMQVETSGRKYNHRFIFTYASKRSLYSCPESSEGAAVTVPEPTVEHACIGIEEHTAVASCTNFSVTKWFCQVSSNKPKLKCIINRSWFKLVAPSRVRHKCRMPYLLGCHIFGIMLTTMNSGRGWDDHFFCPGPR